MLKGGNRMSKHMWILADPKKYLPIIRKRGAKFGGWLDVDSKMAYRANARPSQILVDSNIAENVTKYYRIKKRVKKSLDSPALWEDEFMGYKKKTKRRK
jgi:hypothetical protein